MSGFVYIWFDRKHKRYYIGSHWGLEDDGYICSSDSMREAYRRRPEDFKRRIISIITSNRNDLLKEEQRYLDMIDKKEYGNKYYNINSKVNMYFWWMNEETKKQVGKKISIANKKRIVSDETKQKMSLSRKGHKGSNPSKESREKMRQLYLGIPLSDKIKQKISLSLKGHITTNETKKKMSLAQKGKKLSEEHKAKLRKPKQKRNLDIQKI